MQYAPARTLQHLALALLVAGTGLALAQDEQAVTQTVLDWQERFNEGDAQGVADLYADDMIWIVTSGAVHTDEAGVLAQVNGLLEAGYDTVDIEVTDALVGQDLATTMGTWVFSGPNVPDYPGHYIAVVRLEDGEWRTVRHVSYLVAPPEAE